MRPLWSMKLEVQALNREFVRAFDATIYPKAEPRHHRGLDEIDVHDRGASADARRSER